MSQDQEAASGRPGNLIVLLNGTMPDDKPDDETKASSSCCNNGTEPKKPRTEPQAEQSPVPKQENAAHNASANDERVYRQGNWLPTETLVLLEAKRKEQDIFSGSRRSILTAEDKWKFVSDYCRTKGVQRSKEQCRFKWVNMMPDYRRIRDYEEQRDGGGQCYFDMESWERRAKLLPGNMDLEVYKQIGSILLNKPAKGGGSLSGLKREAREKKLAEASSSAAEGGMLWMRHCAPDGAGGGEVQGTPKPCEERAAAGVFAVPRKSRQKRGVPECRIAGDLESSDDSSTEEDIAVMSGRSSATCRQDSAVFFNDEFALAAPRVLADHQRVLTDHQRVDNNRDAAAAAATTYRQDAAAAAAYRLPSINNNNNCQARYGSPMHAAEDCKEVCHGLRGCQSSAEMLTYIEDRKDARHRELLALEREKLAVFREASFAAAKAMTNAVDVFSKIAQELLRPR